MKAPPRCVGSCDREREGGKEGNKEEGAEGFLKSGVCICERDGEREREKNGMDVRDKELGVHFKGVSMSVRETGKEKGKSFGGLK